MELQDLVTIDDSNLEHVVGGLGSPPVPGPHFAAGFNYVVGKVLSDLTGFPNPNQPPAGLFGWGGLFGIL